MKRALAVGINNYKGQQLKGCVNDATDFRNIIAKHGDGSPNFDVRLLADVPTKSALNTAIIELFSGEVDIALFYFSGHGAVNIAGGYIVTPDFEPQDIGISMDEILTIANASKAKDKIIILDCCHSGALGNSRVSGNMTTHVIEGMTILTATRQSEKALEIKGHGVFTSLLLEALKGGAADLRGHITPGSVYAYIDLALGPWDQRPVFKTNVTRFTSLRTIHPPLSVEVLRKITEYFPAPQDLFPLDPSFEDTNSSTIKHDIKEPYAKAENVDIFKHLQKMYSVGLVVPVDTNFMYFAAMESRACKLTALGFHYWKLVHDNRI
jgi:hypothetical protein